MNLLGRRGGVLTLALVAVGAPGVTVTMNVAGATQPAALPAALHVRVGAAHGGVREVGLGGYRVTVPAAWPVVDLSQDPSACVRFDRHAVYLGTPGAEQRCPARVTGRTETLLVEPLATARGGTEAVTRVRSAALRTAGDGLEANPDQSFQFPVADAGVRVTATFGSNGTGMRQLLGTARVTAAASASLAPIDPAADPTPVPSTASTTYTGLGFETCTAPSQAQMDAWRAASPYQLVGVYFGGAARACAQPNLTNEWLATQAAKGWHLLPIYVGLQAPCSTLNKRFTLATASAEGRAAATDAVAQASALGLGPGHVLYDDMEYYDAGADATCQQAVLTFLSSWTNYLHQQGYRSGVYGNPSAAIGDLASVYNSTSYARPDVAWTARWNGVSSVSDPAIPDTYWANHHRVHQYQGGHNETFGGVRLNVDNDYADLLLEPQAGPAMFAANGDRTSQVLLASSTRTRFVSVGSVATTLDLARVGERTVAGDFNGDGHSDIAVAAQNDNGTFDFRVWLSGQRDVGSWYHSAAFDLHRVAGRLVAGDFNHDGRADVAMLAGDGGQATLYRWLSTGTGFRSLSATWRGSGYWAGRVGDRLVAGDFNHDGYADIAAAYQYSASSFRFHVWLRGQSFGGTKGWYGGTQNLARVGGRLVAGDFDHDGRADLAALYDTTGGARMLRWRSSGTAFGGGVTTWAASGYALGNVGSRMAVGDVNRDGYADVVSAYQSPDGGYRYHVWQRGQTYSGDGGWYSGGPLDLATVAGRLVTGSW